MRQALGRGLEALIPRLPQTGPAGPRQEIQKLLISSIRPNHLQPRKNFDQDKLEELAQSIRENGQVQPIIVSRDMETGSFELIAGERRLRAAQLAGLSHIDAVIREPMGDKQRLAIALIENLQREDLNPIEEALGYVRLMREFSINQTQLCEVVGKSKSAVSNTLRLLDLPEPVQKALEINEIAEGHARALLAISHKPEILNAFKKVVAQKMSVRQVEDFVREITDSTPKKNTAAASKPADIRSMESTLQKAIGTKVQIATNKSSNKGYVKIHFFSLTDFDKIVKLLLK